MKSVARDKSFSFAVSVVKLYKYLCDEKHEYVLSKQLLKSGTSIGANICEALHGQSKKDFLSKANIALKEAVETEYWIELLFSTDYIDKKQYDSIQTDCNEIIAILTSTVKTTKARLEERGKMREERGERREER